MFELEKAMGLPLQEELGRAVEPQEAAQQAIEQKAFEQKELVASEVVVQVVQQAVDSELDK